MIMALAVLVVIAIGACTQRISGMGLGLLGGPVLMIMLGPVEGIMVVNVLAVINAAATTMTVRDHVDWKKFAQIAPVMIFGSIPAAFLLSSKDYPPVKVMDGGANLVAQQLVTLGRKFVPPMEGTGPAISAGILGGFTNTLAGVAGPVITVYAQAARWPHQVYAATLQPIFMVGGIISVLTKLFVGAGQFNNVSWLIWPAGVIGMAIGIPLGVYLSKRIPRNIAHKMALIVAAFGAAYAMLRGIVQL